MLRPHLLLLGACLAGSAQAEPLRCGTSFVDEGDSIQALLQRCGAPTDVTEVPALVDTERRFDPWSGGSYTVERVVRPGYEVWYYNFGPERLVASIRVMNAVIVQISKGGYGN
jgi:hypothetical protein